MEALEGSNRKTHGSLGGGYILGVLWDGCKLEVNRHTPDPIEQWVLYVKCTPPANVAFGRMRLLEGFDAQWRTLLNAA